MQEKHNGSNKEEIARRLLLVQSELMAAEAECDALEEKLEAAIARYNRLERLADELAEQLYDEPP